MDWRWLASRVAMGGWIRVAGWLRPIAVLVVLAVMVAGYRFLPWAPNLPASNGVSGVAIATDHIGGGISSRFIDDALLAALPVRSSSGLGRIKAAAQPTPPYESIGFDPKRHIFRFRLARDRFESLGGRTARVDNGVFELRPLTSGRYLVCFVESTGRGWIALSECDVDMISVPGTVELIDPGSGHMGIEARPLR